MPSKSRSKSKENSKKTKRVNIKTKLKNKTQKNRKLTKQIKKTKSDQTKKIKKISEMRTTVVDKITFKYKCAIWGHGEITQVPFVNEVSNMRINILGTAVAGCARWTNYNTQNYIDQQLLNGQPLNLDIINTETNISGIVGTNTRQSTSRTAILNPSENTVSLYSYIENFGRTKKPRSNKIFTGEYDTATLSVFPENIRDKIMSGPILRIYSIAVYINNIYDFQDNTPIDIILHNNCKLDDVQYMIQRINQDKISHLLLSSYYRKMTKEPNIDIVLDLFDTTCNSTIDNAVPIIGYLENTEVRKNTGKRKIIIYTGNKPN